MEYVQKDAEINVMPKSSRNRHLTSWNVFVPMIKMETKSYYITSTYITIKCTLNLLRHSDLINSLACSIHVMLHALHSNAAW